MPKHHTVHGISIKEVCILSCVFSLGKQVFFPIYKVTIDRTCLHWMNVLLPCHVFLHSGKQLVLCLLLINCFVLQVNHCSMVE